MVLIDPAQAGIWRILNEETAPAPQAGVEADFDLLDAVAGGARPTLRLWENRRCLVVSGRDARLPRFAQAADAMREAGWPVVVRHSGGTAVPHGPGILLLSMVYALPQRGGAAVDDGYRQLCDWMARALDELGIYATCRAVPSAFCDGRYNLAVGPRKVAGTAQRWRRRTVEGVTREGVLAHALLLIDGDPTEMTAAINRFYRLAGADARFDAESVTTLANCLQRSTGLIEEVRDALLSAAAK
jgi:lipoate-protein ligase A